MSAPARLALFAALLLVVGGAGAAAGGLLDADSPDSESGAPAHAEDADEMESETGEHAGAEASGLAVSENGLRLVMERRTAPRGKTTPLRFRVLGEDGSTVRDFGVEHARRMHLIVVRRDMTGFRHLHPRQRTDGSWETLVRLGAPGTYRVFADFSTREAGRTTLAEDLHVPGDSRPQALPPENMRSRTTGGYSVTLVGETDLRFTVSRNGRPVDDLQPYLGARGHLVALREGDLAYLHVHPEDTATAGRDIRFKAEYPSAGRYRLFLQFRHEDRVRTVAFTQDIARAE